MSRPSSHWSVITDQLLREPNTGKMADLLKLLNEMSDEIDEVTRKLDSGSTLPPDEKQER